MTVFRVNSAQTLSWVKNKRCTAKVENRSDLNSTFWILVAALGTIYPNPTHPFYWASRRRFEVCGAVNVANTNVANYQFTAPPSLEIEN